MTTHTLTFVLATLQGRGLDPLTLHRAKAAVPFAGKYRLIDFTLANCLHSGLRKILVLTQYKSHSLHKHLRDAWSIFQPELGEFITPVPPQMREGQGWYAGELNALQQNRYLIERSRATDVLTLEGDLVYRMDYAELIRAHRETGADITLGCLPRPAGLRLDGARPVWSLALGDGDRVLRMAPAEAGSEEPIYMGVCVFRKEVLQAALEREESTTSLVELAAELLAGHRVYAYGFGGERGRVTPDQYWNDVDDLDRYYAANMALLQTDPPMDLYQEDWVILTYQGLYPPARTVPGPSGTEGVFVNSMLAAGTVITGGGVNHSILCPRVRIGDGAIVEDAILFDGVSVGPGAELRRCIVDKEVVIPAGERIGVDRRADAERFTVSPGGIVVIPKAWRF